MHTLYLGPSWAVQSFETPAGTTDMVKTNLAQELGLTNYTSLAQYACSNFDQLDEAKSFMAQNLNLAPFRIIFITANSLQDGYKIHAMSQEHWAKKFLTHDDPIELIRSLEEIFYQQLNDIGVPVALIGGHTDVTCNSHDNITVIHPSWQNFLGSLCNLNNFYGWAADVGHRWLQGKYIPPVGPPADFELEQDPSHAVVFAIHEILKNWKIMEKNKMFCSVHPNIQGNQLFAKKIQQKINDWIDSR